jgi:hypothetical protein
MESRDLQNLPLAERLEWARKYPHRERACLARANQPDRDDRSWSCTLARGHEGIHVAHYGPSAEWPHGEPLAYWVRSD